MTLEELVKKYGKDAVIPDDVVAELELKEPAGWIPKYNDTFYFINGDGKVEAKREDMEFDDKKINNLTRTGNVFKMEEDARFEVEKRRIIRDMEEAAHQDGWFPDWNKKEPKYKISCYLNMLAVRQVAEPEPEHDMGVVYFKSLLEANYFMRCNRDRILKFLFNVKERDI